MDAYAVVLLFLLEKSMGDDKVRANMVNEISLFYVATLQAIGCESGKDTKQTNERLKKANYSLVRPKIEKHVKKN